jgi:predicted  nucleic acid-binding Zn-ribbon protein
LDEAVSGFVKALRDRLRATRGQEKAFDEAVARLREAIGDARVRIDEARDDIARAVRGDAFDDSAFDAAARRIEEAMRTIHGATRSALVDLHDRLDEGQRKTLSDLIGSSRMDL